MGEILSVVNQKGGVGKTTTCVNVSSCLAKTKKRALLVDLDPQSNATRGCGLDHHDINKTINDALLLREDIQSCITSPEGSSFDIILLSCLQ